MAGAKMLTDANKGGDPGVAALKQAVLALDPLGVMPDVGHLLPGNGPSPGPSQAGTDLVSSARKPEEGAVPLSNRRREQFCCVLTGWGGDGLAKRNHEAYEAVYGVGGATARVNSSRLLAVPEVKARVKWMERKVEEARRHDLAPSSHEIDEFRLGLIERAKKNTRLAALALMAARDHEGKYGLAERGAASETAEAAFVASDGLGGVRAILAKFAKKEG